MQETIVVTGASSGIGRALALSLAKRGKKVLAVARRQELLLQLKAINPDMIDFLSADVATEEGRQAVASYFTSKNKLIALVNNAAIMKPTGYLKDIDLQQWRYQMAINVEAPLFLTNSLLPYLSNGRILNITIYSSYKITPGLGAYGISKAALNKITDYLRVELKPKNIKVGLVLPGIVETDIQQQLPDTQGLQLKDNIMQKKKEGKLLSPETSAAFITWLLLDTNDDEFAREVWDIYDDNHHKYWK